MDEGIYKVTILDKEYPVQADIPKERMKKIVEYVNSNLEEIKESNPLLPPGRLAILACLNMANDYFEQKEDCGNRLNHYENRIDKIVSAIDSVL